MLAALQKIRKNQAGVGRTPLLINVVSDIREPGAEQPPAAARQFGFLSAQGEALHVVYGQFRSAAELSCSISTDIHTNPSKASLPGEFIHAKVEPPTS